MIRVSPSAEDLRAASFVAASSDLDRVVLWALSVSGQAPVAPDQELEAGISFSTESFSRPAPGQLHAVPTIRLRLSPREPQDPTPEAQTLSIELSFRAEYTIPRDPIPPEIGERAFEAFANLNALYNCWPYFRTELQHITSLMGLPPFTLPSLMIKPEREASPRKSSRVARSQPRPKSTRRKKADAD